MAKTTNSSPFFLVVFLCRTQLAPPTLCPQCSTAARISHRPQHKANIQDLLHRWESLPCKSWLKQPIIIIMADTNEIPIVTTCTSQSSGDTTVDDRCINDRNEEWKHNNKWTIENLFQLNDLMCVPRCQETSTTAQQIPNKFRFRSIPMDDSMRQNSILKVDSPSVYSLQ